MARADTWDEPFLPWVESANDRRFKKLLYSFLLVFGIISIVVPFLPTPEPVKKDIKSISPHLAKLIIEKRKQPPPPPPQPKAKKKIKKKVEKKKKKLTKKEKKKKEKAVKKAASSGLLAMSSELEDLRESFDFEAFDDAPLKKSNQIGKQVFDKNIITSKATRDSGGIKTSKLTRSTGGGKLASRSTTRVKSSLGKTSPTKVVRNSSGQIVRPEQEIQQVFQKNKGAIFSIYNRALRKDPSLQGKLILELTISSAGRVIKCKVVSSELDNKKLERKIVARVKLFKFKASGAQQIVITYPIDFLPS
jgi:TonB family protein